MSKIKGFLFAIGGKEDKGNGKPKHLKDAQTDFLSNGVLEEIRIRKVGCMLFR